MPCAGSLPKWWLNQTCGRGLWLVSSQIGRPSMCQASRDVERGAPCEGVAVMRVRRLLPVGVAVLVIILGALHAPASAAPSPASKITITYWTHVNAPAQT